MTQGSRNTAGADLQSSVRWDVHSAVGGCERSYVRIDSAMSPADIRCGLRFSGFTLLELLVVVAIIALLAAYVGPRYSTQVGKSEQSVAQSQVAAFSRALQAYRLDVGSYPTTEEGLIALVVRPSSAAKWQGPYLERALPPDPWGRAYIYRSPGTNGADYDIASYGRDGQPGGAGDSADLSNR